MSSSELRGTTMNKTMTTKIKLVYEKEWLAEHTHPGITENEKKWLVQYEKLIAYQKIHGDTLVPPTYCADPGLGAWVGRQRSHNYLGKLRADRKTLLDNIGFCWSAKTNAEKYKHQLAQAARRGEWRENSTSRLDQIGFRRNYTRLDQIVFRREYNAAIKGLQDVHDSSCGSAETEEPKMKYQIAQAAPRGFERTAKGHDSQALGMFRRQYRLDKNVFLHRSPVPKGGYRSAERKVHQAVDDDAKWLDKYKQLVEYQQTNGHTRVPLSDKTISLWVKTRSSFANDNHWLEQYEKLVSYQNLFGNILVPVTPEDPALLSLGVWVHIQRHNNLKGKLRQDRRELLTKIGFVWTVEIFNNYTYSDICWSEMYDKLRAYKRTHGNTLVPARIMEDEELGSWVSEQQVSKEQGSLRPDRRDLLNRIGFVWNFDQVSSTARQKGREEQNEQRTSSDDDSSTTLSMDSHSDNMQVDMVGETLDNNELVSDTKNRWLEQHGQPPSLAPPDCSYPCFSSVL